MAGTWFSVALDHHGHPWTWGRNDDGQLGNGSQTWQAIPARVDTRQMHAPIRGLAAGWGHVLAIDENGHLWVWGSNAAGQLGVGTMEHRLSPVLVDTSGIAGPLKEVAAGGWQSFVIDEGGALWGWGNNASGETGTGLEEEHVLYPAPVDASEMTAAVQAVSVGHHHTLVLTVHGELWAFGHNSSGQLGIGSDEPQPTPVPVDTSEMQTPVRAVGAGAHFSMAVDDGGELWIFGATEALVGTNSDRPLRVDTEVWTPAISRAAGGSGHATVLDGNNRAYAWGQGWFGQLGNGSFSQASSPVAVDITEMTAPLFDLDCGQHNSLVRDANERFWSWGGNHSGSLGDGFTENRSAPVTVVAVREHLVPLEVLVQENLLGTVEALHTDPEADGSPWLVAEEPDLDTHLRVRLPTPDLQAPTTRWQRARALVRPSGEGSGTPTVRVEVHAGGSLMAATGLLPVEETRIVDLRWDATSVEAPEDLENVEVRVEGIASGEPSSRTVEVGAIVWNHLIPWPDPEVPPPDAPILDPDSTVTVQTDSVLACAVGGEYAVIEVMPMSVGGEPMPPLAGDEVTVDADPPWVVAGETNAVPGPDGTVYHVQVGADRCGSREVTVRVAGEALDTRPILEFACPSVSVEETWFEASPAVVPGDGETEAVATVHLRDICGQPAFGLDVVAEPTATDLDVDLSPPAAVTADAPGTGEDGTAAFTLTSQRAGHTGVRVLVEAAGGPDPGTVTIESPPDLVIFEQAWTTDPDASRVVALDDEVLACASGGIGARVAVILLDEYGMDLGSSQSLSLEEDPPYVMEVPERTTEIDPETGHTVHLLTVGSNRCGEEAREIAFSSAGVRLTETASIVFTCPPVDSATASYRSGPSRVPANGTDTARVSVGALDTCGNPAFSRVVGIALTAAHLQAIVEPETAVSAEDLGAENDGWASFDVRSHLAGESGVAPVFDGVALAPSEDDLIVFDLEDVLSIDYEANVQEAVIGQRVVLSAMLENRYDLALTDIRIEQEHEGLKTLRVEGAVEEEAGVLVLDELGADEVQEIRIEAQVGVVGGPVRSLLRVSYTAEGVREPNELVSPLVMMNVRGHGRPQGCECGGAAGGASGSGAWLVLYSLLLLGVFRSRSIRSFLLAGSTL